MARIGKTIVRSKQSFAFIACCAMIFLSSCSRPGKIESKIVSKIHSCHDLTSCRIQIGPLTNFDWDKMYVFDGESSESDRTKALGTRDLGFQEFQPQFVFLKNGRIVYQESEPADVENPVKDEIWIDTGEEAYYHICTPLAFYSVTEATDKDGSYYTLKQVQ